MIRLLAINLFTSRVFQVELKAFVGVWLPAFICIGVTALKYNWVV